MDETKPKSIVSHIPVFTISIIAVCIVSSKVSTVASLFVYDRQAIFRGELWRLITSHFVHFSDIHLLYNFLVFGITGWIIEYKGHNYFKLLFLFMACLISATLLVLKPDMIYFGGLSGITYGTFVYCSICGLREPSPWRTISIFAIIFLSVKIGLETYTSESLLPYWETQAFVPIPLSHITGSIVAFLLFVATRKNTFIQNRTQIGGRS